MQQIHKYKMSFVTHKSDKCLGINIRFPVNVTYAKTQKAAPSIKMTVPLFILFIPGPDNQRRNT